MRVPEIFRFTRMERRGVVALLLICGGYLIAKPFLYDRELAWSKGEVTVLDHHPSQVENEPIEHTASSTTKSNRSNKSRFRSLGFPFDPDTIEVSEWMSMGLSEKQSSALMNYGERIGGFSGIEKFRSSFVVSEEFYAAISDDIEFNEHLEEAYTSTEEIEEDIEIEIIDLNLASAEQLTSVRGIGPKLSQRIVKFRDVLGGFYSMDQLREVYGLEEDVLRSLIERCRLTHEPKKININAATEEELYYHPYFRDGLSQAIVKEREKHGKYKSVEDVRRVYLVDEQTFKRILPYISITDG